MPPPWGERLGEPRTLRTSGVSEHVAFSMSSHGLLAQVLSLFYVPPCRAHLSLCCARREPRHSLSPGNPVCTSRACVRERERFLAILCFVCVRERGSRHQMMCECWSCLVLLKISLSTHALATSRQVPLVGRRAAPDKPWRARRGPTLNLRDNANRVAAVDRQAHTWAPLRALSA